MSVTRMCAIAVLALSVAPALCVSAQAQSTPTSTLVSRDPAGNITLRAVRVAERSLRRGKRTCRCGLTYHKTIRAALALLTG